MNSGRLLAGEGVVVVQHVEIAESVCERMTGLLGRDGLGPGRGMFLAPCSSIHTIGMRFSIDLVFVDASFTVLRFVRDVAPGRMAWGGFRAWGVVEVGSGWLRGEEIAPGLRLTLVSP